MLLMPAHVAWFTADLNVRGLIADSERPAIYTNGRQRWLICSNVDTQRLFDEELDRPRIPVEGVELGRRRGPSP